MSACVRSFTQYSNLTTYLEVCSSLVLTPGKYSIPNCFIRNDIAHIMKLITSWNEIKGLTYRIKNFYLRAIGLIISCTNFNDAKKLLELIFIIALNETDGSNIVTGKANKCDVAKTYLKNRIANDEFMLDDIIQENDPEHIDKHVENIDEEIPDHFHSGYKSQMFKVISDTYNECVIEAKEKNDEGTHDNMHFNEPLAKKLKDFCKFIPIWSAVMVSIFKYGKITESSASSESLFNDLKNRIFNHKTLPLRIDDFIKTHIKSVEGSIILSESRNISSTIHQIQPNNEDLIQPNRDTLNLCPACKNGDFPSDAHKCIICSAKVHVLDECSVSIGNEEGYGEKRKCIGCHTSNTSNINEINEDLILENWGNEALGPEKKRKKKNYLDKDPTIVLYNDQSPTKSIVIGILQNGSLSKLSPVLINSKHFVVTNTCAFDSIVHALCVSMCDSPLYYQFINSKKEDLLLFNLVCNALRDGINVQTYKKRAIILESITDKDNILKSSYIHHINSETTIELLIQKLFKDYPSRIITRNCKNCPANSFFSTFLISNIDKIQNVQSSIQSEEENCYMCGKIIENNLRYHI